MSRTERVADGLELNKAAGADRSDLVLSLVKGGADLEEENSLGRTPLNVAAFYGNLGVVVTLLAVKANIEATTRDRGYTALHTAAHRGHTAVLELLLWKGADITARTGRGWTALNIAVNAGHDDVISSLLARGADIHATTANSGYTALHTAAESGSVSIIFLLLKNGADIKAVTKEGFNALHCAAHTGHVEVVRALLLWKADVYSAVESIGYTALHLAADEAHNAVLRALLQEGADALAQIIGRRTALDLLVASEKRTSVTSKSAVQSCRQQLQESVDRALRGIHSYGKKIKAAAASDQVDLRHFLDDGTNISTSAPDNGRLRLIMNDGSTELALLFDLRADVDTATALGWLPLHLAVHRGSEGIVKTLLDLGADVNARVGGTDDTALKWAVITNKGSIVRVLLEHGANVSNIDKRGWTVLLWAAAYGLSGMVKQLLAYGADLAAASQNRRWTALHVAAESNSWDTVRTLLNGGADPLARTRDGKTALDLTLGLHIQTRIVLQKAVEEASQAKHTREVLVSPSIRESALPSLYEIRPSPLGESDEIIPPELSRFIPGLARERIRTVWASPRQRPSALYNTKKFVERVDNLLSHHAFRQLIQQARDAPLNSDGDKVSPYCFHQAVSG
jgi:ankyrin repeat protein